MARKSRNQIISEADTLIEPNKNKWSTALYIRLSKDDGDKAESNSVQNQRLMLNKFMTDNLEEFYEYNTYIDDGYSGLTLDRPAFTRMMNDVERGFIKCIVVKDLSRFSRDYIAMGNYNENILPSYGVRLIALTDGIDTFKTSNKTSDIYMPIKSILNDQYAKDISIKIRAAFDAKREAGQFIGAFACYGYIKDPDNKNKIIIDHEVADIIKNIFQWFIEGVPKLTIAYKLNELGVPCPSAYKKEKGMKYVNANRLQSTTYWTHATIHRILQSEFYIGNMVQKRQTIQSYKVQKNVQLDKSQWIIVEGTHEAIIDMDTWNKTQDLLTRDTRVLQVDKIVNLFAGYLKCADCKRAMHRKGGRRESKYYVCGTYKNYGVANCSNHSIKEDAFKNMVLQELKLYANIAKQLYNIKEVMLAQQTKSNSKKTLDIQITKLEQRKKQIFKLKQNVFEQYTDGIFTKDEFIQMKEDYNNEEKDIQEKLDRIREEREKDIVSIEKTSMFVEKFKQYADIEELSRDILSDVLKVIYIHENGIIEIEWKYVDELLISIEELQSYIDFESLNNIALGKYNIRTIDISILLEILPNVLQHLKQGSDNKCAVNS